MTHYRSDRIVSLITKNSFKTFGWLFAVKENLSLVDVALLIINNMGLSKGDVVSVGAMDIEEIHRNDFFRSRDIPGTIRFANTLIDDNVHLYSPSGKLCFPLPVIPILISVIDQYEDVFYTIVGKCNNVLSKDDIGDLFKMESNIDDMCVNSSTYYFHWVDVHNNLIKKKENNSWARKKKIRIM